MKNIFKEMLGIRKQEIEIKKLQWQIDNPRKVELGKTFGKYTVLRETINATEVVYFEGYRQHISRNYQCERDAEIPQTDAVGEMKTEIITVSEHSLVNYIEAFRENQKVRNVDIKTVKETSPGVFEIFYKNSGDSRDVGVDLGGIFTKAKKEACDKLDELFVTKERLDEIKKKSQEAVLKAKAKVKRDELIDLITKNIKERMNQGTKTTLEKSAKWVASFISGIMIGVARGEELELWIEVRKQI